MKSKIIVCFGKMLMKLSPLKIIIVDDCEAYFTPKMIEIASAAGFRGIERIYKIDQFTFQTLLEKPPNIIILDIRGVTEKDVAKDGWGVASALYNNTHCFVIVTSAHTYHLKNQHRKVDFVLEERNLTAVDFLEKLGDIVEKYLKEKIRFYKKILFRIGFYLVKKTLIVIYNG